MDTYFGSDGTKYTRDEVQRYVKNAKKRKLELFKEEHGYHFCEHIKDNGKMCGRSSGMPLDMSHTESVRVSRINRRIELAWDIENIKIRCRDCHQVHDKLNVQWGARNQ